MSLFGDLPAPSARQKKEQPDLSREYKPASILVENQVASAQQGREEQAQDEDGSDDERDYKRRRTGPDPGQSDQHGPASGALPNDQVAMALQKLKAHVSNADKFAKASGLLRQLVRNAIHAGQRAASGTLQWGTRVLCWCGICGGRGVGGSRGT